jgi:hypothetical protein
MKRGIAKQISIQRTVTYSFTREDLIARLRLPEDAQLSFDGETVQGEFALTVEVKESVTRKPKAEAERAA